MSIKMVGAFDKFIYVIASIFLLSLAYSEALKSISLVLMLLAFLYIYASGKSDFTRDKINIVIFLHFAVVFAGVWLGIDSTESLKQVSDVIKVLLVFLFFREMHFLNFEAKHIYALLLLGFIFAVIPELLSYNEDEHDFIKLRSVGSVNRSATYIVYIFILALFLSSNKERGFSNIGLLALLLSLIAIILGGSRMAMFSLPVIVLAYFLFKESFNARRTVYVLLSILIIWGLVYVIFPESRSLARFEQGFSDTGRMQIWISSVNIWMQHNLFFGIGVGNSISFSTVEFFGANAIEGKIDNTHNIYLDLLLERGILGLITFLLFIQYLFTTVNKTNAPLVRTLIFSLLLMGLANITFRYEFALLLACIFGVSFNKHFDDRHNVELK